MTLTSKPTAGPDPEHDRIKRAIEAALAGSRLEGNVVVLSDGSEVGALPPEFAYLEGK